MKKFAVYLYIILSICLISPAFAQMGPFLPKSDAPTVKQEDIKKLIETLKSDTDRGTLLSNLEILLDEQAKKKTQKLQTCFQPSPNN